MIADKEDFCLSIVTYTILPLSIYCDVLFLNKLTLLTCTQSVILYSMIH